MGELDEKLTIKPVLRIEVRAMMDYEYTEIEQHAQGVSTAWAILVVFLGLLLIGGS